MKERTILCFALFFGISQLSWTTFAMDEDEEYVDEDANEEYSENEDGDDESDGNYNDDLNSNNGGQLLNPMQMTSGMMTAQMPNMMQSQNVIMPMQLNGSAINQGIMRNPMQVPMQNATMMPIQNNGFVQNSAAMGYTVMPQQNIIYRNNMNSTPAMMMYTSMPQQQNITYGNSMNSTPAMMRYTSIPQQQNITYGNNMRRIRR